MRVAASRHVVAGVDEFEVGVRGGPEECDGRGVLDFAHEIFLHLPVHFLAEVWGVERLEDLFHEILLIG